MKLHIALTGFIAVAFLSGCGQDFQPLSSLDSASTSKSSVMKSDSVSSKILQDVAVGLQQGSANGTGPALSQEQIAALIQSATAELQAGGIGNSTDLEALLPVIVEKLTKALADLKINTGNAQTSELIASIGKLVMGSVTHRTGTDITPELVALISKALFQNLPVAGISSGNLSSVAGALMSSLVTHLGQQGLPTELLSSLLQSASSGATNGIGHLNLHNFTSAQIADILHRIGLGSTQGLTRLSSITSNNALLQTLLGAIANGAQQGLNNGMGAHSGLQVTASQLLASLIAGQGAGISNSTLSEAKQHPLSLFLQLLLSRI